MVLVEVINLPVRYGGKTYRKGELFQVESHHVAPKFMKLVGEVDKDQADIFVGEPIVLNKDALEEMSIEGLKDYAKAFDINLGKSNSKDGIIEKIVKAQKEVE